MRSKAVGEEHTQKMGSVFEDGEVRMEQVGRQQY